MVRLILENKKEANWFHQFWLLKKQLKLTLRECIKLFISLKRDKAILIQSVKDEKFLNDFLDVTYFILKNEFDINVTDVPYGLKSIIDANHFNCYIVDYLRGYRIYISRV